MLFPGHIQGMPPFGDRWSEFLLALPANQLSPAQLTAFSRYPWARNTGPKFVTMWGHSHVAKSSCPGRVDKQECACRPENLRAGSTGNKSHCLRKWEQHLTRWLIPPLPESRCRPGQPKVIPGMSSILQSPICFSSLQLQQTEFPLLVLSLFYARLTSGKGSQSNDEKDRLHGKQGRQSPSDK